MTERYLALTGAIITFILAVGAYLAVGRIYSDAKAIDLINQLAQSALYFGSAIATSSATTLALMLTVVGMAKRSDADFGDHFYRNVYHISAVATTTLLGSILLLFLLTLPVGEFDGLSTAWYIWLYRIQFGMVGILSALLVGTVLLLFATVRQVISKVTPTNSI